MDAYTAHLAVFDHIHELIALKQAHVVAKARHHGGVHNEAEAWRLAETIERECADLAIILNNWVVSQEMMREREEVFLLKGNRDLRKMVVDRCEGEVLEQQTCV